MLDLQMRVLGYHATRPHLRVLNLPKEVIEPSPVPLNAASAALDSAVLRDGWIAFSPDTEVWGISGSFTGKAFRIGRWWSCVPAVNPRTVWLSGQVAGDYGRGEHLAGPNFVEEYDGVRRETVRQVELPAGFRLVAATQEALVLGDTDGRLWSMPWDLSSPELICPGYVRAQHGSRLAIQDRRDDLSVVDLATGSRIRVRSPLPGPWGMFGSFSPDGSTLALDVSERPPAVAVQDAADDVGKPKWRRLALISAEDGAVRLVDGRFDNFASAPLWRADGSWLIFDAPFDKSMFVCRPAEPKPVLDRIVRRRGRPNPLVDITELLPAASPATYS